MKFFNNKAPIAHDRCFEHHILSDYTQTGDRNVGKIDAEQNETLPTAEFAADQHGDGRDQTDQQAGGKIQSCCLCREGEIGAEDHHIDGKDQELSSIMKISQRLY